jgi:RNA polymerase sigma factor (TIGR02999 family)
MDEEPDITGLLNAYGEGAEDVFDEIMPVLYRELKRLAHARMRNERPGHTLNTTGLVHEAYLKLIDINAVDWQSRRHFLVMASKVMRRILVNYARDRKALKRGGGAPKLPLDEELFVPDSSARTILDLDAALQRLETVHSRAGNVVQHRYFAGFTNEEIAEVLGVSVSTVERDLRFARAWLLRELKDDSGGGTSK